jgi:hypothetical protein
MILTEIVKNFLKQPEDNSKKNSSNVKQQNVLLDLSNEDLYPISGSFFDSNDSQNGFFNFGEIDDVILKQKNKIMTYRQLSMTADVTDAIDEIVNEIIFSYDDQIPLKIEIDTENEKIIKTISEKFDKIIKLTKIRKNLFSLVKNSYIDGQIIIHCAYDKNNTKNGIKSIKMIEPCMLYFDKKSKTYKYLKEDKLKIKNSFQNSEEEYTIEELIKEDFGLRDGLISLSYLEYAVKPANMLKTLEDLLIPLRFSRSISRRVFNVDIGDLPHKRGTEVMSEYQSKFKYKKFYNNETGEVSNQQHITSMVEDYWFANRSGGKGTTVDVLDETGNLGEMNDILYFAKKLYRSMKIPSNRIDINPEGDKDFSYDETRTTKEDMKFFMFISRLRQVYSSLFKEILKREIISTGILSETEWNNLEDSIRVQFVNENKFIEKMKLDNFMSKLEIYTTASEHQGKLFSVNKILTDIFKMTQDEIIKEFEEIKKEEKNPLFNKFYGGTDDGESKW